MSILQLMPSSPIHTQPAINGKYISIIAFAVFFSWILHELAHWLTGICLGYEMMMTLNQSSPVNGFYRFDWHYQLISAAGPLFTLIEALLVFILMRNANRPLRGSTSLLCCC